MKRAAILTAAGALLGLAPPAYAQGTEPAGGAAIGEIVIATVGAMAATAILMALVLGHRSGRITVLRRLAAFSERVSGLPGWAALPAAVATVSLLLAVFGMYWDIALHIGVGRDEGPLANPAHYFILAGLFGIFSAGFIAMGLPDEPVGRSLSVAPGWNAPLGGVLIAACGAFSLIGFPLDDVWHRLFGQDVTLWGPTHLMLIGGASMTLVGIAVLLVEGVRSSEGTASRVPRLRAIALMGGLMLGLSTFQAEFDFGVPQFRMVFGPMLVMLAAGVGLVAARMYGGPGVAVGAVGFFLAVRGILALLVGPVFGETTPHMPLYVVEALLVEAVALRVSTRRPLAFGLWCGAAIGTVGLAAEWAWTQMWMPLPWQSELLPEGALLGFAFAVAGALLGAWVGDRLSLEPHAGGSGMRVAAMLAAGVVAIGVPYALNKPAQDGVRGSVTLADAGSGEGREVHATVRLDPPNAADGAEFVTITAWQGGGLVVDHLRRVSDGVYRSTQPIPVHGNWKALVRLHRGSTLSAMPIFLPRDAAIPAAEVSAAQAFTRAFVADHEILQREARTGAPLVTVLAYSVVAAIALGLLALIAWGLHRLATPAGTPARRRRRGAVALRPLSHG